jgi:hypothetical protein
VLFIGTGALIVVSGISGQFGTAKPYMIKLSHNSVPFRIKSTGVQGC